MAVYRVPLRRVFNKSRMPGDLTWNEVYGKVKCCRCHKHFAEGDPYLTVTGTKIQFAHVGCA